MTKRNIVRTIHETILYIYDIYLDLNKLNKLKDWKVSQEMYVRYVIIT